MASVKKSVLVPFSAHRMYSLVDDVQSYPQFLPWCGEATLLEQTEGRTVARLMIDYRGIRHAFTTENQHLPGEAIRISLLDGPFRRLDGEWRFTALLPDASKVALEMHYEFKTGALDRIVGPVFGHIANSFVDAFTRRAESLFGS
jgi:ribosome-associated toxin RatA of RatAB toxin-antitoxin module